MKKQSDTADNIQDNKKKRKGLKILILVLSILLAFVIIISVTIFVFLKIGEKQMLNYEDLTIEMPSVAELDDGGKTVAAGACVPWLRPLDSNAEQEEFRKGG